MNIFKRFSHGFSVIEMLVVIAIIALAMLMALPYMSNFASKGSLDTSAEVVMTTLRYARQLASARSRNFDVVCNNNTIIIQDQTAPGVSIGKAWRSPRSITVAGGTTTFAPNGSASGTLQITLNDVSGVANTAYRQVVITVNGTTGRVSRNP